MGFISAVAVCNTVIVAAIADEAIYHASMPERETQIRSETKKQRMQKCSKTSGRGRKTKAVFDALGAGLTEACYQNALALEFRMRGHEVEVEPLIPITYRNTQVGFVRLDILLSKKTTPMIIWVRIALCASSAMSGQECGRARSTMFCG